MRNCSTLLRALLIALFAVSSSAAALAQSGFCQEPPGAANVASCAICRDSLFSFSTAAATPSNPGGPWCGSGGVIDNDMYFGFFASATSAVFKVAVSNCSSGTGIQVAVFDGDRNQTSNCFSSAVTPGQTVTITATGLQIGGAYLLGIDGFAGSICNFTVTTVSGVGGDPPLSVGPIEGPTGVCFGDVETYRVPESFNASGYYWAAFGIGAATGVMIDSPTQNPAVGNPGREVVIRFPDAPAGTSPGECGRVLLRAYATNACLVTALQGPTDSLYVEVCVPDSTASYTLGSIAGPDTLCLGETGVYEVAAPIAGAGYAWSAAAPGSGLGVELTADAGPRAEVTATDSSGILAPGACAQLVLQLGASVACVAPDSVAGSRRVVTVCAPARYDTVTRFACAGPNVEYPAGSGVRYGVGTHVLSGAADCARATLLVVREGSAGAVTRTVDTTYCRLDGVRIGGVDVRQPGIYEETRRRANGCDSVVRYRVTAVAPVVAALPAVACAGDTLVLNVPSASLGGNVEAYFLTPAGDTVRTTRVGLDASAGGYWGGVAQGPTCTRRRNIWVGPPELELDVTGDSLVSAGVFGEVDRVVWLVDRDTVSTDPDYRVAVAAGDTVRVEVCATNACGTTCEERTVAREVSGALAARAAVSLSVYPNPAARGLRVAWSARWRAGSPPAASLTVTDAVGRALRTVRVPAAGQSGGYLPTDDLPAGAYRAIWLDARGGMLATRAFDLVD